MYIGDSAITGTNGVQNSYTKVGMKINIIPALIRVKMLVTFWKRYRICLYNCLLKRFNETEPKRHLRPLSKTSFLK